VTNPQKELAAPQKGPLEVYPRASGILLHPTSLPGRFGVGDLGEAAYRFVDFLAESRQHYWHVMPLAAPSYGDSPSQVLSALLITCC
jgi:4-alpha-glucanotransferase